MENIVNSTTYSRVNSTDVHRRGCANERCSLSALSIGDGKAALVDSWGAQRNRRFALEPDMADRVSDKASGEGDRIWVLGDIETERLAARLSCRLGGICWMSGIEQTPRSCEMFFLVTSPNQRNRQCRRGGPPIKVKGFRGDAVRGDV